MIRCSLPVLLTAALSLQAADPVSFENSPRLQTFLRAGNLYLSMKDAIALAIDNNLDVQFQKLNLRIADTDVLRSKGGGLLRGVTTGVTEVPTGFGSTVGSLLNIAAAGNTAPISLPGYSSDLGLILPAGVTNSGVLSMTPLSTGSPIPVFDPSLVGTATWGRTATPETSTFIIGTPSLSSRIVNANVGYQQGFSSGTTVNTFFNNNFTNSNTTRSFYNPYTLSNLGVTIMQPLLRGFGPNLNRRFIRIAKNDRKISDLVFQQQLISTVSGVIRLYQDFVSLNEDARVKRDTLALAQKLFEDNKNKVELGTLAPIEVVRAQAQVAAARQDLINSEGFAHQQELVLKNVLTRRGTADPVVAQARIIPTDTLEPPDAAEVPLNDLFSTANAKRPDLTYAGIQIDNSQIQLAGSRDLLKPEIDLVASAQNSGLAGTVNPAFSGVLPVSLPFEGNYSDVLGQLAKRNYPSYSIGVNVILPLRNRVARADVERDELQLRQSEVRRQQLTNQVRLEVEDALVDLDRSRGAYGAAAEARKLQEQSLEIEQERFNVGLSTTFLVLQYQSFVAQARSTEIAAKATYSKARTALDRATGLTLERNGVSVTP